MITVPFSYQIHQKALHYPFNKPLPQKMSEVSPKKQTKKINSSHSRHQPHAKHATRISIKRGKNRAIEEEMMLDAVFIYIQSVVHSARISSQNILSNQKNNRYVNGQNGLKWIRREKPGKCRIVYNDEGCDCNKKRSEKAVQITLFRCQIYHFHSALQMLFLTSNH